MTAEDTILYMMSFQCTVEARQLIAFEACSYSVMMSRIVTNTFVDVVALCCIRHGMTDEDSINKFKDLKSKLATAIQEISKDAGIPSENEQEGKERFKDLQSRLGIYLDKTK